MDHSAHLGAVMDQDAFATPAVGLIVFSRKDA
jgi:hypothetical protein